MNPVMKFPNVYLRKEGKKIRFYSKNLIPGISQFEEKLVREGGIEYREWEPKRSKLAAAIMNKISQIGIKEGNVVLYLGASHGYTASFVSDMIGKNGFIFAIDFAPVVVRDLVFVCEQRKNMTPILADCNHPEEYADKIVKVDIVYQDVAQKNQVEIFLKNMQFAKPDGFGLLALKARSIDVTKKPREVFREVRAKLEKEVKIVDYRELEPFEKDHAFFVVKK
jgi:fibrillarin-like pre-rRNA processing protein